MTVGIMQPYFLPYIGYWQLLAAVDRFVIYDNIQYTKKGWINRNRFLRDGRDVYFTVPLKKASDYLNVVERQLADDFDRDQLLRTWSAAYRRAPHVGARARLPRGKRRDGGRAEQRRRENTFDVHDRSPAPLK